MKNNTELNRWVSLQEVGDELKVNRASVYYFIQQLGIETKKFELDRKKYILKSDLERIKTARAAAKEGRH